MTDIEEIVFNTDLHDNGEIKSLTIAIENLCNQRIEEALKENESMRNFIRSNHLSREFEKWHEGYIKTKD